ncbi:metallophosphoesterase family protein [Denitromonas sp.]|uniref:metallophosphoesterase family protein n=1 Tax=Denitromonas sp. TaxID=2734609 RepID=UPI002AFE142B|nr:metallophosphoesterase [Denitromonas sp.]
MSILFCGDPHGLFEQITEAVRAHQPEAVILLGDMEASRPLHVELAEVLDLTELWWIPGNHDTDEERFTAHLFDGPLADRNLHGRVVTIAGLRVAGLGGVFRGKVWAPPAPPLFESYRDLMRDMKGRGRRRNSPAPAGRSSQERLHLSTIFPADWQALARQRADVLVTHEAPSVHRHGWPALDELGRALGVRLHVHGHHHNHEEYAGAVARLGYRVRAVGAAATYLATADEIGS